MEARNRERLRLISNQHNDRHSFTRSTVAERRLLNGIEVSRSQNVSSTTTRIKTNQFLSLLYLFSKGLLCQLVLYMSKFIILNKEDYYYILEAVTHQNSWESWIEFMLEATEKTSLLTNNRINEILSQMESTFENAKGRIKWYSKEVNEVIFSLPYIKPSLIGTIIGKTSRTTLTKCMNELFDNKNLTPRKDRVGFFYINEDLIRILEGQ
jgi:hypothetical protein